jgi:uncharacterized protein YnzC (UPF0291/DUF896 family)
MQKQQKSICNEQKLDVINWLGKKKKMNALLISEKQFA